MVFYDWQDAVRVLQQRVELADPDQLGLASKLGIVIRPDTPALVAASWLRRELAQPLRAGTELPISSGQEEFLADLLKALKAKRPRPIPCYEVMSAWISVFQAKRAITALEREQPRRGDVVSDRSPFRGSAPTYTVSSIGESGVIFPQGAGGPRIPAHRIKIVVRADDDSQEAADHRRKLANARALRARSGNPSAPQLDSLEPFRCAEAPDAATVALLSEAIATAEDERPLQRLIERHPEVLSGLTTNSWGCFVRPQVSLAGQKRPDFLLAIADSAGIHWTLIELESPTAVKVGTQKGALGDSARKGIQQIEDWREWLTENLAHARSNTGLHNIRPESPALVIVGRRESGPWPSPGVRQRLAERQQIALHSWDWLVEALEHGAGVDRPGGPLDWPEWRSMP